MKEGSRIDKHAVLPGGDKQHLGQAQIVRFGMERHPLPAIRMPFHDKTSELGVAIEREEAARTTISGYGRRQLVRRVRRPRSRLDCDRFAWRNKVMKYTTAIFRQVNKQRVAAHHDALEFPDGQVVLLTFLCEGQQATVLQLPAEPKNSVAVKNRQSTVHAR